MPLSSSNPVTSSATILLLVAFGLAIQPQSGVAVSAHGSKAKCTKKGSARQMTSRSRQRAVRCAKPVKRRSVKRLTRIVTGPMKLSLGAADAAESLTAIEDTHVTSSSPTTTFGSSTALRLDTKPGKRSYVKFDVPLGTAPVTQAVLMIYATSSSRQGALVRRIADPDAWFDWSVTWNSRPTASSTVLAASGRYSSGAWVSLDVTSAITAGTRAAFELTTLSTNQTTFASAEAGTLIAPQLKITRATVAQPVVDSTPPDANATPQAPPDGTPPSAPASLTASAGNAQVQLAWNAASDNLAVTGYRVYRNGALIASPTATTYTDTGLTNGTSHTYTVKATDAANNLSTASNTANATPQAPPPPSGSDSVRPYDPASPWNAPIGVGPTIHPLSSTFMNAIADNNKPLTSDPDQYALPVYLFDDSTPRKSVQLREGYWQSYDSGDNARTGHGYEPLIANVPIPAAASQSAGSDGQIIFWNPATCEQWEFWQWRRGQNTNPNETDPDNGRGNYATTTWVATNATRYHTCETGGFKYYGRFNGTSSGTTGTISPQVPGVGGRGAGTPYLAGMVRPWEIAQGRIDHALAFAYQYPASGWVYPATKSDGAGVGGVDPPEGARIQLDPTLSAATIQGWGCTGACLTIAKALQTYGMYVIDNSGSSKIYLEDRMTAGWDGSVTRDLVSSIPWNKMRVVQPPTDPTGGR